MNSPLVSIVICTYNRGDYLAKCLDSLKRQNYPYLEIIAVNGPSNDNTDEILKIHSNVIRINQEKLNGLSAARNLGIKAAHGEIIAFIDDDAIADEKWISSLIEGYTDDTIGGVGGPVFDKTGNWLQFRNGYISKLGNPSFNNESDLNYNDPMGKLFNYIMGTNASFRVDVLYKIGLFDDNIRYYLDETDVCVRVIKSGYKIKQIDNAIVFHEMAEGHNRVSPYDLNWQEIMKSTVYFILKNFPEGRFADGWRPLIPLFKWFIYFLNPYYNGEISESHFLKIYYKLIKGLIEGYKMKPNTEISIKNDNNKNIKKKHVKICLLSQEFSEDCNGGICRYTYDLAHEFAELGNEVHIISRSERNYEYDYRDREIYVHKICPSPIDFLNLSGDLKLTKKTLSYSYAACIKILQLIKSNQIQIIEAPLWDSEGFVFSIIKEIPIVIRIETPLSKVAEIMGWHIDRDLRIADWIEGEAARRADKVIAISNAIGSLIHDHHAINDNKIVLSPLGIRLPIESKSMSLESSEIKVLFVGRLEKRKGLETLFKAIPIVINAVANIKFILIGKDTNSAPNGGSYKQYLIESLDNSYRHNIVFVGFISNERLDSYYNDCHIFVAPSLYESFGLIFLEAMARGKPVVGCDVGGVSEVVMNNVTGILVQPGDEVSLANAIILLQNSELREEMGMRGRKLVKDKFSIREMSKRSLDIYIDVINGHKSQESSE